MAEGGNELSRPVEESDSSGHKQDIVTPFIVESEGEMGFKYDKLKKKYITQALRQRIEAVQRTNGRPANNYLKRKIIFSQRDLENILDSYEKGEHFYLYTGRGPSTEAMHIGHLIPFKFTRWLQEVFDVPLVIQMSDDEKYFSEDLKNGGEHLSVETVKEHTRENVKDIISLGFNVNKTFIFSNFEYKCPEFYKNICRVQKRTTMSRMKELFELKDACNIGQMNFPALQAALCFSSSFPDIFYGKRDVPCLVPCAIDQGAHFDLAREVATKMNCKMPALIHSKFVPSLKGGLKFKMSASVDGSSIYLKDTDAEITDKISSYNSGKKLNDKKVFWDFLGFFMDDDEYDPLITPYEEGRIQSDELKTRLIKTLKSTIGEIRERRRQVTDEMVDRFMTPRPLNYKYNHGSIGML